MRLTTGDRKLAASFAGPRDFFAARASGNHLVAQNDEPELFSEVELIAGDKARAEFSVERADARAHADEVHRLRCVGAL